jgi:hypothetical protein
LAFGTVLSYMAFLNLKYTYVGKKNIKVKPIRIWIRNTALFPCKFADLRFADRDTKEIY